MASSRESIKCDSHNASTIENKPENLLCDNPCSLDEFEIKPLSLQDLKDRFSVTEKRVMQVLTRADEFHKYIEDLTWETQMKERHKGVASGVTSTHLGTIKEAFERMKSDYLQLLMDRDLAIKFAEDKKVRLMTSVTS